MKNALEQKLEKAVNCTVTLNGLDFRFLNPFALIDLDAFHPFLGAHLWAQFNRALRVALVLRAAR